MIIIFFEHTKRYVSALIFSIFLSISLLFFPEPALAAPACEIPSSGDWIVNSDCDLIESSAAPANIFVRNNATLKVLSGKSLEIDSKRFRLQIAPESRLVIEPNGKVSSDLFSSSSSDSGDDGETASSQNLFDLFYEDKPSYIEFGSRNSRDVVFNFTGSFGTGNEEGFKIELPIALLDDLLPVYDGNLLFPKKICGFNFIKANRFIWLDSQGNVLGDPNDDYSLYEDLFNSVPEVDSVEGLYGSNFYNGGIPVTGSIGSCASKAKPVDWVFPFPLFTSISETSPLTLLPEGFQLIFQGVERIEFLQDPLTVAKQPELDKLLKFFDKENKKRFEDIFKTFPQLCGIVDIPSGEVWSGALKACASSSGDGKGDDDEQKPDCLDDPFDVECQ